MRKVIATIEATVLIPVRVTAEVMVQANEGASIARAIKGWAKGQSPKNADVELWEVLSVAEVGTSEIHDNDVDEFTIIEAAQEAFESDEFAVKIHNIEVTDSK